jgi:hypothetical protein
VRKPTAWEGAVQRTQKPRSLRFRHEPFALLGASESIVHLERHGAERSRVHAAAGRAALVDRVPAAVLTDDAFALRIEERFDHLGGAHSFAQGL